MGSPESYLACIDLKVEIPQRMDAVGFTNWPFV